MASIGSISLDATINTSSYNQGTEKITQDNERIRQSTEQTSQQTNKSNENSRQSNGRMSASFGVIAGVASSMASSVMSSISGLTGEMVESSDSAQKFSSTLKFAGIGIGQIDKLTKSTQDYADRTVFSLSDIRNTTAQLASNGVQGYGELAQAAGNLTAVAGGGADAFKSVGMVLTQTAGAGKLTTENWNQLADAIPGASGKLQAAMKANGAYTGNFRDAMSKGEITAAEFNEAISDLGMTDAAKEAATSTKTIEGAFGNLQATVVTIGTDMLNGIKPALTGFMSDLSTGLSNGATMIQNGFSTLLPSLQETFGPAAETLKSSFSTAFDTLKKNAKGMGDSIGSAFQSILKLIKPVADFISNNFGDAIEAISAAAPPLLKGISDAFGAIQTVLQPIIDKLGGVLTKVSDAVWKTFKDTVTDIGKALSSASDWITKNKDGVTALVAAIGTIVAIYAIWTAAVKAYNIATKAATAVQALFNLVMNANPIMLVITLIAALVAGLIYFFTQTDTGRQMWQSFTDWLKDTWNNISTFFSNLWGNITGFFTNAGTNIQNAWNNTVNWFKELPGRILGAFQNIGKKIGDTFGKAKDWIMSKFSGAGNWLKDTGSNMIKGLWNGIKNVGNWLKDKIMGIGKSIVGWAKSALGIHSPSKVFADEIGAFIPSGIAVGIDANINSATGAIDDINEAMMLSAASITPDITQQVTSTGNLNPYTANAGQRSAGVTNNIHVETMDAGQAAAETMRQINFTYV